MNSQLLTRRSFICSGAVATSSVLAGSRFAIASAGGRMPLFSKMGIAASMDRAATLKAAGAQFLTENTSRFLVPDQPEGVFERNLERLAKTPLPVLACNGFIRPKHLRCVGDDATPDLVLEWANTCFRRLNQAGGSIIVFGSSGSRRLKDNFPKETADKQFVALLKRMGPLAAQHKITVTLEQLRERECNYLNHIAEVAAIVRAVNHPNVRALADLYHMAKMGDTPADLEAAMDVVVHVEIAEKEGRTVPGVGGDDFRPFFRVLRKHGYHGAVSIEGRWEMEQVGPAFKEIARQAAGV